MKLRHKLIKWLSFGDMILINAEVQQTGSIAPKETGSSYLINTEFRLPKNSVAIRIDEAGGASGGGMLTIKPYTRCVFTFDCIFTPACRQALKGGE